MAFIEMNMYSSCLDMDTSVNVLLPETKHNLDIEQLQMTKKYQVVYVLHGYSDNYSSWIRKSIIELVARNYEVIVVMPEVNNSFYANREESKYYDYLTKELPIKVANYFPASIEREDTFIMGNSMGGYGAFMIAMNNPEKYAAAFSFSGILGLDYNENEILMNIPNFRMNCNASFKNQAALHQSKYYLYNVAKSLDIFEGNKPDLFHICGMKDKLAYNMGVSFIQYVKKNTKLEIKYEEIENGDHDWNLWNSYIETAFRFFKLKKQR